MVQVVLLFGFPFKSYTTVFGSLTTQITKLKIILQYLNSKKDENKRITCIKAELELDNKRPQHINVYSKKD